MFWLFHWWLALLISLTHTVTHHQLIAIQMYYIFMQSTPGYTHHSVVLILIQFHWWSNQFYSIHAKQEFYSFFPVKVLHYFTQRSENLSLLKRASDLRYNQEIISLNKFLNFYKFEIVYTSLLDHHGRCICVTKGRLFTKHQCLRYSKVTDCKNRLKLSISSRLLKLYG